MAIDGISLWLVMLTVFITPIAAYASFGSIHARMKDWCFALLLLEAAMLGALVALDLFLFYMFWELMLVPMVVMIGVWGGTNRLRSAIKFFLYTMFGSVLMLGALIYVAYQYARVAGHPSFDYFDLQTLMLPRHLQIWLWAAFTLAFVIKVPMFPVHTWLPDAHTEAPTAGSVILAAVMLKMGTYGYLRYAIGLFPEASAEFAANLAGVAVLGGIIYGALCAWKQTDVKRLIAYSSVAHLGYVMLGLFAVSQAASRAASSRWSTTASHRALFLLFGVIYDRRHTRQLEDFGGLAKAMPVYATLFVLATLASIGRPGTQRLRRRVHGHHGHLRSNNLGHVAGIQAVGAAIGVILGALYMLTWCRRCSSGRSPATRTSISRTSTARAHRGRPARHCDVRFWLGAEPPHQPGCTARSSDILVHYDYRAKLGNGGKYYDGPSASDRAVRFRRVIVASPEHRPRLPRRPTSLRRRRRRHQCLVGFPAVSRADTPPCPECPTVCLRVFALRLAAAALRPPRPRPVFALLLAAPLLPVFAIPTRLRRGTEDEKRSSS